MTAEPTAEFLNARFHRVDISPFKDHGIKEEVHVYFRSEWRGQPCTVEVSCDRYTHSSGLSEWRAYAAKAYYGEQDASPHGDELTDLARSRVGPPCVAQALAWLDSDDYRLSEAGAYRWEILHRLDGSDHHMRPTYDNPTREVRQLLERYVDKMDALDAGLIAIACDKYDEFAKAYRRASPYSG
jgi:hypothetical protein